MSFDPETSVPLPWREGIKGRGNTPTLILPRPRDKLGICDKGEEIMVF
jgi:hypothetical protein